MKQKRKIGVIQAGGTILCVPSEKGLAPGVSVDEVVRKYVPESRKTELSDIMEQGETFKPFGEGIDSSEMDQSKVVALAQSVVEAYKDHDAIVIAHGTDTMAETATALSYLLRESEKPIIITGSQHSPGEENSDAGDNLADAFEAAAKGRPGVYLSFNGSVMQGSRACKVDSESKEAFVSVNKPKETLSEYTAQFSHIENNIPKGLNKIGRYNARVRVIESQEVEETNGLINEFFLGGGQGLIFKGLGAGNTHPTIHKTLKYWLDEGKTIVMASKCEQGKVNPSIYETGMPAVENGILCGLDMGTEAMKAKLKYLLSNCPAIGPSAQALIKRDWYTNLAGELDQTFANEYLLREQDIIAKAQEDKEKAFRKEMNTYILKQLGKQAQEQKIIANVTYTPQPRNKDGCEVRA